MNGTSVWNFLQELLLSFAEAGQWLITDLNTLSGEVLPIPFIGHLTPLSILFFNGLTLFLGVALVKWLAK